MRKSFDGLTGIVQNELKADPLGGAIFIFLNRRRNQVKLLLWEGDGFSLYHKRLEKGSYELPAVGVKIPGMLTMRSGDVDHPLSVGAPAL